MFFQHFVPPQPTPILSLISAYGWLGVEIFFAISSFLMLRLLCAEDVQRGDINVIWFYIRRALRIYPLMMVFALIMIFLGNPSLPAAWAQFLSLASATDNYLAWFVGYNYWIPYTAHLWTLSYELQIYLFIPIAFFVLKSAKARGFVFFLVGVECICIMTRLSFVLLRVKHPVIWVTPFMRPKSTLLGLALGAGLIKLRTSVVFGIAVAAIVALITQPNVQDIGTWTIAIYPVCALISGSLVYLATQPTILARILGTPVVVFLGKISFGLYVYHFPMAPLTHRLIAEALPAAEPGVTYAAQVALGLILTIAAAMLSYFVLERPFLRIKERFTLVSSRPI